MAITLDFHAGTYLSPADVQEFVPETSQTVLTAVINDVFAQMVAVAPVLDEPNLVAGQDTALVTSILRQSVISYVKSDGGNVSTEQEMAGPFSRMTVIDSRSSRRGLLTGVQVEQLRTLQEKLGATGTNGARAVEVDLLPATWVLPSPSQWW